MSNSLKYWLGYDIDIDLHLGDYQISALILRTNRFPLSFEIMFGVHIMECATIEKQILNANVS